MLEINDIVLNCIMIFHSRHSFPQVRVTFQVFGELFTGHNHVCFEQFLRQHVHIRVRYICT